MKKNYLLPVLLLVLLAAIVVSVVIGSRNFAELKKYMDAGELINKKEFAKAIEEFKELGEFKDSKDKILSAYYEEGKYLLGGRDFEGAREAYKNAGSYKDASKKIDEVSIAEAKHLVKTEKYLEAANIYEQLGKEKDRQKTLFKYAKYLIENNESDKALEVLKSIEEYEGAKELIDSISKGQSLEQKEEDTNKKTETP